MDRAPRSLFGVAAGGGWVFVAAALVGVPGERFVLVGGPEGRVSSERLPVSVALAQELGLALAATTP